MIEPGHARRGDLAVEIEVGSVGERQCGAGIVRTAEAAHFDEAADRRRMLEGFNAAKSDVMGAAIGAVDHGIGFTGQFIMQAAVDQAADDWRAGAGAVDRVVAEAAILSALGEGAVHRLDDVSAHAEIAQGAFGPQFNGPLAGRPLNR